MSRTVLIVEDEHPIRMLVESILHEEGYCVKSVANGREALIYVERFGNPALILLDLNMPEMDGFEFLKMRELNRRLAAIPVIVVSAISDSVKGFDIQGSLAKPFNIRDLIRLVQKTNAALPCRYGANCPNFGFKYPFGLSDSPLAQTFTL